MCSPGEIIEGTLNRGGIDCGDLLEALAQSFHCIKPDNLWYAVFEVDNPIMMYEINFQVTIPDDDAGGQSILRRGLSGGSSSQTAAGSYPAESKSSSEAASHHDTVVTIGGGDGGDTVYNLTVSHQSPAAWSPDISVWGGNSRKKKIFPIINLVPAIFENLYKLGMLVFGGCLGPAAKIPAGSSPGIPPQPPREIPERLQGGRRRAALHRRTCRPCHLQFGARLRPSRPSPPTVRNRLRSDGGSRRPRRCGRCWRGLPFQVLQRPRPDFGAAQLPDLRKNRGRH